MARCGGQVRRVRSAIEGHPRLERAEGSQRDPVRQVGLQAAQATLLQTLGGEQQVDPDRTTNPSNLDEQVDEVGLGHEHLGELVTDHEQRRQRREIGPGRTGPVVVTQ